MPNFDAIIRANVGPNGFSGTREFRTWVRREVPGVQLHGTQPVIAISQRLPAEVQNGILHFLPYLPTRTVELRFPGQAQMQVRNMAQCSIAHDAFGAWGLVVNTAGLYAVFAFEAEFGIGQVALCSSAIEPVLEYIHRYLPVERESEQLPVHDITGELATLDHLMLDVVNGIPDNLEALEVRNRLVGLRERLTGTR